MSYVEDEIEAYKILLGEDTFRDIYSKLLTARYAHSNNPGEDLGILLNHLVSRAEGDGSICRIPRE